MTFRAYLTELVGTFLLVFFSAGVVLTAHLARETYRFPVGLVGIAVAQGAALAVLLAFTTRQSLGCLNPAVTLALWVTKRFDLGRCFALIVVQLIGAVLGGGLAISLFPQQTQIESYAATPHLAAFHKAAGIARVAEEVTPGDWIPGSTAEVVLTFLLTLSLLTTVLEPKRAEWPWVALYPGLALTAAVLVGYNLSGAALNPARWFGTAIWQPQIASLDVQPLWRDHLPYWMGPIVGALLAAVVYSEWLRPDDSRK